MQKGSGTGIGLCTATAVATVRNGRLIGANQDDPHTEAGRCRDRRCSRKQFAMDTAADESVQRSGSAFKLRGGSVIFISANEFFVACPPGAVAGLIIECQAPTGQIVQVLVPAGVVPGQVFQAQIPKQSPAAATATIVSELRHRSGCRIHILH